MNSQGIYTDRTPYFYVIQHTPSGKKYAGCRFARGCHPSELMKPNGYKTSSKIVHSMIRIEGIESFVVVETRTIDQIDLDDIREYESRFLEDHQCAKSNEWINLHNNYGNYGATMHIPEVREKILHHMRTTNPNSGGVLSRSTILARNVITGEQVVVHDRSKFSKEHNIPYPSIGDSMRRGKPLKCGWEFEYIVRRKNGV